MPSAEASRRNLEKAFASPHFHQPLPWRSPQETRVIECLAGQWFMGEEPRCSLRELARRLGVSQTHVQELARQFAADPSEIVRHTSRAVRGFGMASVSANGRMQVPFERRSATFEQLNEAQAMSRKMRNRGWRVVPTPGLCEPATDETHKYGQEIEPLQTAKKLG